MTLVDLFKNCAYKVKYEECGDHVNYAFVEDGRTLYIYFQGSRGDVDWRRNFSFWKKPYKDMKNPYRVHAGFCDAWKEVEDIVIAKITEVVDENLLPLEYKWKKIITVGYSHGGALAAFCHECVVFHRGDIAKECWGIGFEAPRMYAGLCFRQELRARWKNFRVIRNRQDIVTHVPPRAFGFWHVGEVIKVGGRWRPFAALMRCFEALKAGDKAAAKIAWREVIQVYPHYQTEVISGLEAYDATSLLTEMGI